MDKRADVLKICGQAMVEGKKLHLEMALPYSHGTLAETIVVENDMIPNKLEYLMDNYNEYLEMNHNAEVKILNFFLK